MSLEKSRVTFGGTDALTTYEAAVPAQGFAGQFCKAGIRFTATIVCLVLFSMLVFHFRSEAEFANSSGMREQANAMSSGYVR